MKTIIRETVKIIVLFFIFSSLAYPNAIDWPELAETKIEDILRIKKAAMKLPSMRSEDGTLGKRSEALMDELGAMVTDSDLIQKLNAREREDIKAKIALWAIDRKKRPEEYRRLAKYYVNRPNNDESAEYYSRTPKSQEPADPFAEDLGIKLPTAKPQGVNPVDEDDQIEENRLILEYCFFMPPSGEKFHEDLYRTHLVNALFALGHPERSLIVMASDAEAALVAENQNNGSGRKSYDAYPPLIFMAKVTTNPSFSILSELRKLQSADEQIQAVLNQRWKDHYWDGYQASKNSFDAWQALAREKWETPHEKAFAEWLLAQPAPPIPPPPQHADGPNDPFLPPRPPEKKDKE